MSGPAFTSLPRAAVAGISAANANRTDSGTIVSVFTAGSFGSKIERVRVKALVTTTAGTVRLWAHNGVSNFLLAEIPIPANTVSATNPGYETDVDFSSPDRLLVRPSGWSLRASTEKAESFNVHAFGGDFPAP